MACSRDISNDIETEDILSKHSKISPNLREKPLSPVLTGGLSNRRFLISKRLNRKKSTRVKLTNRFKESDEGLLVVNPINVSLPVSFDDNLSASQTETLIDHLNKLEELDNSRKKLYKLLIRDDGKNDNLKKIPSPIPTKLNETQKCEISEKNINVENESSCQRSVLKVTPISPKNLSTGFQTAKGKSICVSEIDVKKHSNLFNDIIYPTRSFGEGRQNKHTFLSKQNCKQNNFKCDVNFNLGDCNLKCSKTDKVVTSVQSSYLENCFTKPSSNINISEKAIVQGKHFFAEEEFNDIKFNNENLCGFKTASVHTFISANACKEGNNLKTTKDDTFSLTQAICDSGISNTQIINAFDNILHPVEKDEDFRGFTRADIKESCTKLLNMNNSIEHSLRGFSRKRKRSKSYLDNYIYNREERKSEKDIFAPRKKQRNSENTLNDVKSKDNLLVTNNNSRGFASASGKPITISEKYLKDAEAIFNNVEFSLCQDKLMLEIEDFSKNKVVNNNSCMNFQKASGKSINISENSLRKAKNIFDHLDVDISNKKFNNESVVSELTVQSKENEKKSEHFSNDTQNPFIFCNNDVKQSINIGFSKASGREVNISENALNKVKNIFDNLNIDSLTNDDQTLVGQSSTTSLKDNVKAECFNKHENYSVNDLSVQNMSKKFSVSQEISLGEFTAASLHKPGGSNQSIKSSKRKLGMSHFRPMQICDNKLDKAKLLFDEDFSGISPIKPKRIATYTSTPIKQNDYLIPVKNDCPRLKNSFSNFVDEAGITPIKKNVENIQAEVPFNANSKIVCMSPSREDLIEDLEKERKKLECRLRVLLEREKLAHGALHRLQIGKSADDKKSRKGLLYRTKTISNRKSLVAFVNNEKPGEITTNTGLPINAKNAENVHFTKQTYASTITEDGAIIIPNSRDMVGLPEIKNAFEAMPGVESRLIPKGWINNHCKWIVWKLASYENMFPNNFGGCLSIENIIQQLKYRYDREIDRAERSALRKICEKDDAPQKRMILFVSDIKMLDTRKYELELCDGWYAVRTIIDEPLCNQIIKGKIEIGTKLLISGAELLNCDGCHPLEATNLLCLKINCNCTRRAIWHAKLGYQRNSNPFPVQLHSIYPLGGTIAAIKVCIARVYPLKYMERLEGRSVWRNRKAEEIVAQKWENERSRKVEQIEDEVRTKFKKSAESLIERQSFDSDIRTITCPKQLYDILERSNDAENLQQNLSASQKEAVLTYQSNLTLKKQQEIAAEVSVSVSKMKLAKRDVVAVLKLLVIDVIGDSDRPFSFFIWRPTEVHMQSLKEGKSFTIQNVLPRPNGDLNSTMKTTFQHDTVSNSKHVKYKRRLVSLEELVRLKSTPYFNEFDTVGIVVQTKIESHRQEVWITDNARSI
ncbi:breast cancer type 2 susceptibility protein-like isoform X2 [Anoplophora glabripennis]|uniref:breast cancer type 2 susceptibility protein-like isoform X2 n=1 Tax=Anoplophora glabripennis TaxID=217634 RepID=UPI000874EB50|nr:breast cancer type 2 susceptibility protein-like isoform X2 [Anoplophora glabripennis]